MQSKGREVEEVADPIIIRMARATDPFSLMQSAPLGWGYSVCFKIPGKSRLGWVHTRAQSVSTASKAAQLHMGLARDRGVVNEYGITPSYWQDFGTWVAMLTKDQYDSITEKRKTNGNS